MFFNQPVPYYFIEFSDHLIGVALTNSLIQCDSVGVTRKLCTKGRTKDESIGTENPRKNISGGLGLVIKHPRIYFHLR